MARPTCIGPALQPLGKSPPPDQPFTDCQRPPLTGSCLRAVPFTDTGPAMIRIVLADDHAQFRAYLKTLLEQQPGLCVVGEAAHGQAAVDLLRGWCHGPLPDVLLMDVEMPGIGGAAATRAITALHPSVGVIALSLHHDPHVVDAMREAGARAYLVKGEPLPELVQTITRVAAGL